MITQVLFPAPSELILVVAILIVGTSIYCIGLLPVQHHELNWVPLAAGESWNCKTFCQFSIDPM